MVGENTASARAPAITAHEPLDTSPSLENHAGHRLRHRRPPPVRGREEVLRRQEGTRRDARESKGKRHRDSAVLFRPRRKNPASRLPARHAAATDRRSIPPFSFAIRRLSPSSAMCASRRTGPSAPPRTRCVSRRCVRLDVRVPSARQALKRDFSATDDALRERAHADRDRADHTPRASGDDPALHTRRASLTFPVHSYRVRSHREPTDRVHQHRGVPFRGPLRPRAHREQELRRRRFVRQDGRGGAPPRAVARPRRFHHRRCRRLGLPRAHHLRGRDPRPEGGGLLLSVETNQREGDSF